MDTPMLRASMERGSLDGGACSTGWKTWRARRSTGGWPARGNCPLDLFPGGQPPVLLYDRAGAGRGWRRDRAVEHRMSELAEKPLKNAPALARSSVHRRDAGCARPRRGSGPRRPFIPGGATASGGWQRCKDLHRGQRCFIIGNGPSLRQTDMSNCAASSPRDEPHLPGVPRNGLPDQLPVRSTTW